MDRPFRAPINRTAELQLILRQVAQGYHFWTADQIPTGNAMTREGRIAWMGYELIRQPKQYSTSDHRIKTEITWTWRLPTQRYKEIEAHLVTIAKHRRTTALAQTFAWLQRLPMFAGLRSQVVKLHQEANKVLLKVGGEPLPALKLPYVGMQRIW